VVAPIPGVVAPVPTVVAPVPGVVAPVPGVVAPPGFVLRFLRLLAGAAPVPNVVAPGSSFSFFSSLGFFSSFGFFSRRWTADRRAAAGIAGTGIGNGDRAPGTHQQARCEHANTAAKRKCDRTTICPQPSKRYQPHLCHILA